MSCLTLCFTCYILIVFIGKSLLCVCVFCFIKNGKTFQSVSLNGLVGLVVRCPPRERKVPGSNSACAGIFAGSSRTSDSNIGTPVATLPGA